MLFKNKSNSKNIFFKRQASLNPNLMNFVFMRKIIVLYKCKEIQEKRATENLNKRSYFTSWKFILRVKNKITSCKFLFASCEMLFTSCRFKEIFLRVVSCVLRVENFKNLFYELRVVFYEFKV